MKVDIDIHTSEQYLGANHIALSVARTKKGYLSSYWVAAKYVEKNNIEIKHKENYVTLERLYMQKKDQSEQPISVAVYMSRVLEDPLCKEDYRERYGYYKVYNAEECVGLKIPQIMNPKVKYNPKFVEDLPKNLGVKFYTPEDVKSGKLKNVVDKGVYAYYKTSEDYVYLPDMEKEDERVATKLHELCHSTKHKKRLNRVFPDDNGFNSEGYAREELRAELASVFLLQDIGLVYDISGLRNHQKYVRSWLKILTRKPEELSAAIDEAGLIESYILHYGKYNEYFSKGAESKQK
jgi:antirestriction protein ArdC